MTVEYTVYEMTREDLDEVLEIERSSFRSPWSKKLFLREIDNHLSYNFAAREGGGKIIGYIVFWIVGDEVHIQDLAVHKDFRKKGIGRALVMYALNLGQDRECSYIFLEVRKHNKEAFSLYNSLSFREIGVRKRYYSNGEDAVVMGRELTVRHQGQRGGDCTRLQE